MILIGINEIYHMEYPENMIKTTVTLIIFAALFVGLVFQHPFNAANASNFSKNSSTKCEGSHCQTLTCINNNCHRSSSLFNSTRQLLNSTS